MPNCLQKEALLCIYISTSFGLNNFRNTWTMRVLFSTEHGKFNLASKSEKKFGKTFMVFQIISFQLVSVNFVKYFGNTGSSQSTCYQTDLKS